MREKQRAELHKTIWSIANELRGSVDGWDFKAYILITLFYRFISEDITSYINAKESNVNTQDFDYAKLDDATAQNAKDALIKAKGYFILLDDRVTQCFVVEFKIIKERFEIALTR